MPNNEININEKIPPILSAFGISFTYQKEEVIKNISLELNPGEIMALIGPNGSGKSTLLKILSGVISWPHWGDGSGIIKYRGQDFLKLSPQDRAQRVVYVPSFLRVEYPISAIEVVLMGKIYQGKKPFTQIATPDYEYANWAMDECQCWSLRHRDYQTLSQGESQRVSLARALVQGAKVLLLDESFSFMDLHFQVHSGKLLRRLRDKGYGILWVSHDVNLALEWADSAILIKDGECLCGGPACEVLCPEKMDKLYPGVNWVSEKNTLTGKPRLFFAGV